METKLKSAVELTNLEAEKELTELRGGCWHEFDMTEPIFHVLKNCCLKCEEWVMLHDAYKP